MTKLSSTCVLFYCNVILDVRFSNLPLLRGNDIFVCLEVS